MDSASNLAIAPGVPEKVFTFLVLLLSSGAFQNLTFNPGDTPDATSGQAGMQIVWIVVYVISVILLVRTCKGAITNSLREYPLMALAVLAIASTTWSDNPSVSLRRGVALALTCLFGVYFASRFTLREQMRLLGWVCGVSVLVSYPFGVLGLGTPSEEFASAWYGVFVHKNDLGRMMVLSIAVFLLLAKSEPRKKPMLWSGAFLALVLLFLSQSATSVVALAVVLAAFPFCRSLNGNKSKVATVMIVTTVTIGAALYWLISNLQSVMELLGKDITLTGRLPLWILSGVMALRKPWFGYGYNAFWLGPGSASDKIWAIVGWKPPHAHNGLLELWLELGLLGVVTFLVGFFMYSIRAIRLLQRSSEPEMIWPFLFLVLMAITNLTEVTILSRNNLFWIVYTAVVISVSPHYQRAEDITLLALPEGHLA